jgi:SAM-dependent methyltransferase
LRLSVKIGEMAASDECALYTDPDLYDALFSNPRDVVSVPDQLRRQRLLGARQFYLEEAGKSNGSILDVGCGSGRLMLPMAESGAEVWGIDLSASMLSTARAKADALGLQIPLYEADMRSFQLNQRFATILIAGNSLLHLLTADDILQCLRTVRRHLREDGRFIFDVSKWDLALLARGAAERHPVMVFRHPPHGEVTIEESASYNAATQVRDITWFLSTPATPDFQAIEYRLRVIFPQELPLLLELAGLRLDMRYGEFTRVPFDTSSPRQVCICSLN